MSLDCFFLDVLLCLGARWTEEDGPPEGEGLRLMMDNGWEGHGTSAGHILD